MKPRLKSKSGLGGIPDAYAITLSKPYVWFIVENELASHDVYDHIVAQVSRFMSLIEDYENQRDLTRILYDEIKCDEEIEAYVKKKVGSEIHHFLTNLIAAPPKIALIIDNISPKFDQATAALKRLADTQIVEFKTYVREDAENVKAHLFEPLITTATKTPGKTRPGLSKIKQEYLEFYTELADRIKEKLPNVTINPRPIYYCQIPTGIGSVHFEWLFKGNPRRALGVELHFEKKKREENLKILSELKKAKDELEQALGENVVIKEKWGRYSSKLYIEKMKEE